MLRQGAPLAGIGVVAGIAATLVAGRAIPSQLSNTSGCDLVALSGVTRFFTVITALACWLPARRATKVNPTVTLVPFAGQMRFAFEASRRAPAGFEHSKCLFLSG